MAEDDEPPREVDEKLLGYLRSLRAKRRRARPMSAKEADRRALKFVRRFLEADRPRREQLAAPIAEEFKAEIKVKGAVRKLADLIARIEAMQDYRSAARLDPEDWHLPNDWPRVQEAREKLLEPLVRALDDAHRLLNQIHALNPTARLMLIKYCDYRTLSRLVDATHGLHEVADKAARMPGPGHREGQHHPDWHADAARACGECWRKLTRAEPEAQGKPFKRRLEIDPEGKQKRRWQAATRFGEFLVRLLKLDPATIAIAWARAQSENAREHASYPGR